MLCVVAWCLWRTKLTSWALEDENFPDIDICEFFFALAIFCSLSPSFGYNFSKPSVWPEGRMKVNKESKTTTSDTEKMENTGHYYNQALTLFLQRANNTQLEHSALINFRNYNGLQTWQSDRKHFNVKVHRDTADVWQLPYTDIHISTLFVMKRAELHSNKNSKSTLPSVHRVISGDGLWSVVWMQTIALPSGVVEE